MGSKMFSRRRNWNQPAIGVPAQMLTDRHNTQHPPHGSEKRQFRSGEKPGTSAHRTNRILPPGVGSAQVAETPQHVDFTQRRIIDYSQKRRGVSMSCREVAIESTPDSARRFFSFRHGRFVDDSADQLQDCTATAKEISSSPALFMPRLRDSLMSNCSANNGWRSSRGQRSVYDSQGAGAAFFVDAASSTSTCLLHPARDNQARRRSDLSLRLSHNESFGAKLNKRISTK